MSSNRVTLEPPQLRDLELALAGVMLLPDGSSGIRLPSRLASGLQKGQVAALHDAEGTEVATLSIDAVMDLDGGRDVSGDLTAVRDFGHRDLRERRATVVASPTEHLTVITGDVPGDDDRRLSETAAGSAVAVLDHGDSRALRESVDNLVARGLDVVVIPAPDGELRSHGEWLELIRRAAGLVAATVTVWETSRARGDGCVVLLTGLSGSGKSTIAKLLAEELSATDHRTVSLLDGDEVRLILSSGLGFSREDRDMNVRRIGWVASLVARHGGVAVCAPIAPYASMRAEMRARVEQVGRFVLVHVATPLKVCEARDRKGLYARARRGEIPNFTGIDDPYEAPTDADVVVDTTTTAPAEAVAQILRALRFSAPRP